MRRAVTYFVLISLLSLSVYAAPAVRVSASNTEVITGEVFSLEVKAEGKQIKVPVLPEVQGLEIDTDNVSQQQSTNMSFINGKMSSVTERSWVYRVRALREGTFTIPPFNVEIDNKKLITNPVTVRVSKPSDKPLSTSQRQNRSNGGPTLEDVVFAESEVDKHDVYLGEMVTLTLRAGYLTRYNVGARQTRSHVPETEGFYVGNATQEERFERRNGFEYSIHEIKQQLFPTSTGVHRIGSWRWEGLLRIPTRNFFPRNVEKYLETEPIQIAVKPLPEQPEGFSGAVGDFKIKVALQQDVDLIQGVPIKLYVRVIGTGNPDAISAPLMPEMAWAHLGTPEAEVRDTMGKPGPIEKVFSYPLTPQEPGKQLLPPVAFCYFDPATETFETAKSAPVNVYVKPSQEKQELVVIGGSKYARQGEVEILGEDIFPIMYSERPLQTGTSGWIFGTLVFVLPPMLYGAFLIRVRQQRKLRHDTGYARKYFARSRSMKRLKEVAFSPEPTEALYRAVIGFLGDMFNVNEQGMTSADAKKLLERHSVEPEMAQNLIKILRRCERVHYGGEAVEANELDLLTNGAADAMDRLEALLKKGGQQ